MFSGEDSSGDALNNAGQFATWAISQTTCNPGSDKVDWAALAQQWIQMKESASYTTPPMTLPPVMGAPPINSYEEKGEADMEVVKDDENGLSENVITSSGETGNFPSNVYPIQPGWQSSWYPDQSQWRPGWSNWPPVTQPAVNLHEINAPPAPSMTISKPVVPPIVKGTTPETVAVNTALTAESIKRKTLPAWIREGLEKMEKEKLKQIERQKDTQQNSPSSDSISKNLNVSPVRLANDIVKVRSEQSFHETDDSDEENDVDPDETGGYSKEDIDGSRIDSPPVSPSRDDGSPAVVKSQEELLEEWMIVVRRSLTELLLEVTNEEIQSIAQETYRKCKSKASSAQVFRKSAISSITGKLGLGAYADSASDNSESEDEGNQYNSQTDSEDELRETIRSRQNAFKAIALEIELSARKPDSEARLNVEHEFESKVSSDVKSMKKGYDLDSGEPQPDKKSQHNGKRSRERTSRFSDAKDLKNRTNAYTLVPPTPTPSSSHSEFEPRKQSKSVTSNPPTSTSASKSKRYSDSSSSSSDSSDSYQRQRHRRTREKSHKSSSNGNSSNRRENNSRDSYDSDEYSSRRSKKYITSRSKYSRDRSRSRSRSPSRSRSRSQSYTGKSRR